MPSDPTDLSTPAVIRPPLRRGVRVGGYEIEELLGQGGAGKVYAARDLRLGRRVALKVLRRDGGAGLLGEAQAMARLSHPNVVTVHEAESDGEQVYLVMELVEGQTVREWLAAEPRGWREIVAVFVAAGRGLAAAHAAGIVHRDFKPDNVLVGRDGRVRVGDFGLAAAGDAAGESSDELGLMETVEGGAASASGTPAYMAPEQHTGRPVDGRADQFAFCVSLHEALYGRRPFAGATTAELRRRVLAGARDPPPRGSRVPARLRPIILRGLEPDPQARHSSMDALVDALAREPAARRWRLAAAATVMISFGLAAYALQRPARRVATSCTGRVARDMMKGVWDTDVKGAVFKSFGASSRPDAGEIFADVAVGLDRYTEEWVAVRKRTCRAVEVKDRTIGHARQTYLCLLEQVELLQSLTSLLVEADDAVIGRARAVVAELPPADRCARATSPIPPREIEEDVATVRRRLSDAEALWLVGRVERARPVAREALAAAERLPYSPLRERAEALVATLAAPAQH